MDIRTKIIDEAVPLLPREMVLIIGAYAIDQFDRHDDYDKVVAQFLGLLIQGCSKPSQHWYRWAESVEW